VTLLRYALAILTFVAAAACAAPAAAEQIVREDLNIVIPSAARNVSGKLVVHAGGKWDAKLDDLLVQAKPAEPPVRSYGDAVVNIGERQVRVALRKRRIFAIPADPKELRVWTVGNVDALIGVVPGEVLTLRVGGPTAFWNISSARLDPSEARPPVVYCSKVEDACRSGFVEVLGARNADPLCRGVARREAETKRCMIPGEIRVAVERDVRLTITDGDPGEELEAWDAHTGEVSEYMVVSSGTNDYWSLGVGKRSYLLVIGPGEKWTVKVKSDGTVSGVRD
jgi:hypothetical protein